MSSFGLDTICHLKFSLADGSVGAFFGNRDFFNFHISDKHDEVSLSMYFLNMAAFCLPSSEIISAILTSKTLESFNFHC